MSKFLDGSLQSLLLKVVKKRNPSLLRLAKSILKGHYNSSDKAILCQLINEEFCEHGVDQHFEPTQFGCELERLLECVNRLHIRREKNETVENLVFTSYTNY
jgi:hypothetical protein